MPLPLFACFVFFFSVTVWLIPEDAKDDADAEERKVRMDCENKTYEEAGRITNLEKTEKVAKILGHVGKFIGAVGGIVFGSIAAATGTGAAAAAAGAAAGAAGAAAGAAGAAAGAAAGPAAV